MTVRALAALFLSALLASACHALTIVQLRPERPILVSGPHVTLGDIALVSDDDPKAEAELRAVRLTLAPVPGSSRAIDGQLIRATVRCAGWEPSAIGLRECPDVTVETRCNRILASELLDRVRKIAEERLSFPPERITVEHTNLPPDCAVPAGTVRITAEPPAHEDFIGLTCVPFSIAVDDHIVRRVSVNVVIRVRASIAVANRAITRGQPVTAADFRLVERDLSTAPTGACVQAETVVGKLAKVSIAADQVICERMLQDPPLVHAQEQVTIQVVCNNVSVRLPATALMDGRLGEEVRVVVSLSARTVVTATVVDRGLVVLTIPGGASS